MKKKLWLGLAVGVMMISISGNMSECYADPLFYSTSTPTGHWYVSTVVGGVDGQLSSFSKANFQQASAINNRTGWIANNSTGTNGGLGTWTFFIFRQTFDLTGYDAASANLNFQWAADDSGQVFSYRGAWTPKFSLNDGAFTAYPGSPTATYSLSSNVDITSGFVSGSNHIDFYVEGNGVTDGFDLQSVNFTANASSPSPTPEPATLLLMGTGLAGLIGAKRKKKA
ncbi:MAG: PEP-CTERM sorting domain-containing protein [Desulfobacteraceae bacterium]|nr:PEP-CTERM sorting domain-containing protein [Desulfobacteraceae bacterium]